jgi:hypothetical protein
MAPSPPRFLRQIYKQTSRLSDFLKLVVETRQDLVRKTSANPAGEHEPPYQSILIPLVQFLQILKLYGTTPVRIAVHVVYGLLIVSLIFRDYFANIPDEMIRSGPNRWRRPRPNLY